MHFETTVEIDATRNAVWDILVEVERWPDWTKSIREVECIDGTTLALGSSIRIKQPRMPSLVWKVSAFEPGSSFTWQSAGPGVTTVGTHLVKKSANRVAVTLGIHQSGALASIIGLLAGARMKRYVQMEADGLKKRSEADTSLEQPRPSL